MIITIGLIFGTVLAAGILFVNFSPQFGGKATEEQKKNLCPITELQRWQIRQYRRSKE